jgi:hypothetical protein
MRICIWVLVLGLGLAEMANAMPLPEITSDSEEGWHDFNFAILQSKKANDGTLSLDVAGTYQGKTLAFRIRVLPEWKEKTEPIHVYWGHATLLSSGSSSDSLVEIMDLLYGAKIGVKKFKKEVPFEAVALQGNPASLEKQPVKLKLFYDSSNQENYAEIYLNIDLAREHVWLNEKDAEYRKNIVRALGD